MKRTRGRASVLSPEQEHAIRLSIAFSVAECMALAAHLSKVALKMTMALECDTPNLAERLKPIMTLAKAMNAAYFHAVRLDPSILLAYEPKPKVSRCLTADVEEFRILNVP